VGKAEERKMYKEREEQHEVIETCAQASGRRYSEQDAACWWGWK
jgi:hypothetical protein